MGLTTDFNQSPYFDDFDETKNFYRTLFKPGVAVQARELTQLQTVLQNQIERFGNNILVDGTIIQGCNFTEIRNLAYVKILDLNTNGQPVSMSSYDGLKIVGATTGVKGVIQTFANGLESQDPDLNTLYFKYTDSGSPDNGIKTFSSTENLLLLNRSNTIIDTVTVAGSILDVPADAVGRAYGVKTGDGIIYQKGFFSRVEEQLTVVSKYTDSPNNVVVGFSTDESIINSNIDTSLLDNANGFNNYNAPGADRLKLTPILVTKTLTDAIANSSFFAIQEYAYGRVVRRNNDTQYNKILDVIENRTKEESGNYIVSDFKINTSDSANTQAITLDVNRGLAYVEGKRVELLNKIGIDLPKSTNSLTERSQNISTNYGNYVLVNEFMGRFDTHLGANVALYDAEQNNVTDGPVIASSPTGNSIGTAKIMAITYDSGTIGTATAVYKAYISDITMADGKKWNDVLALVYSTNVGTADLVSTTIYDQSFKRRIFNIGRSAIKALPAATTSAFYTFRTVNNSLTMSSGGAISFTLPSGEWPYSGGTTLNPDQKKDFILISGANSAPYVANRPIDLSSATVTVTNTTNISITVSAPAGAISNCILYYNGKKDGITAPTQKVLETVYVKIACNTATTNTVGPWCLGFPDVYSIDNVYVGNTSIGYQDANTAADKTSFFVLNSNQKDDYYGLATISKKSGLSLDIQSNLVVKLTRFKKGATDNGFFTVSSYPIDDANTANTAAIQTYEIPTFKSNDVVYDLRDVVDFRPYAANTAANSITSGSETVNPSAAISFSTGGLVPTPNKELVSNYEYYLARKDLLIIDASGEIVLKSGTPAETPIPPADPSVGMVLADISVPPFPSLTATLANSVRRKNYGVSLSKRNNRSYTMRDIGQIDSRVNSLEYYAALSLLETQTKDLVITGADGLNRFKNGIFVENFDTLLYADLEDPEYNAGYNISTREISPIFREYPLSIKPDLTEPNSNVDIGTSTVSLNKKKDNKLIDQPYATTFRRLADQFWSFTGTARIYPSSDGGWDTTIIPAPSVDDDSTTIYRYTSNGNAIRTTGRGGNRTVIRESAFDNAFMRPQNVRIRVTGLRPNARHWFKFDGRNINQFCAPGAFLTGSTRIADIYSTEADGTAVTSDSRGNLLVVFTIPQNEFRVGTREFEILDISPGIANQEPDFYTSYASISYTGLNPERPVQSTGGTGGRSGGLFGLFAFFFFDPLAQTFRVDRDAGKDNVIMLSKLEMYFRQKPTDSNVGVTVEIRETDNGYPSATKVLKNGKVYLENSDINTSQTGTAKTIVVFDEPVELKTNKEYAFVAIPDNNHPEFSIFLSKTAGTDFESGRPVTQDTFDGTLFTSTNGRAWTPYQDENAKFTLFNAEYDKTGYQHFTNTDHEFFTIAPSSGSFRGSELIAKVSANLAQTVGTVKSNTEISYSGATLVGTISAGDWIGYWANTTIIDVLKVVSANTTKIVVDRLPKYANNDTKIFKTVVGERSYQDNSKTILHLTDSSASAEYAFANGDVIRGAKSQATATISSIDKLKVSLIKANIIEQNHLFTDTKYEVSIIRNANNSFTNIATNQPLSIDDDNLFNKEEATIPSRSLLPSSRSFRIKASLSNTQTAAPYDSTPIIDFGGSTINVFEYIINNVSTNENKPIGGDALAKYITLPTILAENLDADDLNVFLTAYRPAGTTIEVYGRFKNKSDPRPFDEIEWTELTLKDSSNLRSSSANVFDYRELEYVMPSVATDAALTNGGGAALNIANSNNLTYKDRAGAIHIGYKQYAIKIVFLAESYARIPKVKNIRAIALS